MASVHACRPDCHVFQSTSRWMFWTPAVNETSSAKNQLYFYVMACDNSSWGFETAHVLFKAYMEMVCERCVSQRCLLQRCMFYTSLDFLMWPALLSILLTAYVFQHMFFIRLWSSLAIWSSKRILIVQCGLHYQKCLCVINEAET